MSRNKNIVYEGWLTKSPPSKRVAWRAKWSRRWFTLRQSCELPGQYFLDYYADRNSRKLKGTIDLDLCEQVDAGLQMQRRSSEGSAYRGSVFSIRTTTRIYHLEADCVLEMEKWVEVICQSCGMKSTDDDKFYTRGGETAAVSQPSPNNNSGPYIAISECITGPPKPNVQEGDKSLIFVFNSHYNNIQPDGEIGNHEGVQMEMASRLHSLIEDRHVPRGFHNKSSEHCLDNDSVFENDEAKSMNHRDGEPDAMQRGINKTFARLSVSDRISPGTPMPPRPPKPSHLSVESAQKEAFIGPRIHEPSDIPSNLIGPRDSTSVALSNYTYDMPRSHRFHGKVTYYNAAPPSERGQPFRNLDHNGQKELNWQGYRNLKMSPPAVNRGLKPGRPRAATTMSLDHQEAYFRSQRYEMNKKKLQYLDLDLDIPSSDSGPSHMKTRSAVESPTVYKTVDFLKTEALNMTRLDTEAYRRNDVPLHE